MITVEEQLTTAAAQGDEAALSRLLKQYDGELHGRISTKIGRPYRGSLDADDVLQVTYLEAFLRIQQFVPDHSGGFLGWLTRIAENNLRDAIRMLNRDKRPQPGKRMLAAVTGDSYSMLLVNLADSTTSPSSGAAASEIRSVVDSALSDLPPDYSKVVRLYDLEGESIEEVARAMRRSRGAVHMLRVRAHDRLRELLGEARNFFTHCA